MRHRCIVGDVGCRGRRAFQLKVLLKLLWKCETIERKNYHHQLPCGFFFNIYTFFFILFWKYEFAMSLSFLFRLKSGMKLKTDLFFFFCRRSLFKRWDQVRFIFQVKSLHLFLIHQPIRILISSTTILSATRLVQSDPSSSVESQTTSEGPKAIWTFRQCSSDVKVDSIKLTAFTLTFFNLSFFKVYIYLNNFVFCFISLKNSWISSIHASSLKLV